MEYLTPSVEYLIPLWGIFDTYSALFNYLREIFHTSVECLTPSVEYLIRPWNI